MEKRGFVFGVPRTLQGRTTALEGVCMPEHRWRRYLLSLTRHKAKKSSGFASYQASGWDEWQQISGGQAFDRKRTRIGDVSERFVLVDPWKECSWEEIARPTLRQQSLEDDDSDDDIGGYGCGNVHFVKSGDKYVSLLGADCLWTARVYDAQRGAVPNPYTVRVRIVTMVTTIIRGNTPEESEVKELFASRAEFDEILLHGWNSGMAAWAALSQLDRWHMHWYKLFATGMILIGQVHHGASQFDVKVMELHLLKLHNDIKTYIEEHVKLDELTGDLYGRMKIMSVIQPEVEQHVAELRRRMAFEKQPLPVSSLPPLNEIWEKLRKSYVPPPRAPVQRVPRLLPMDEKALQMLRDETYARQLAKEEELMSDELANRTRVRNEKGTQEFYENIRQSRPDLTWAAAWDLAVQKCAENQASNDRRCKRLKNS